MCASRRTERANEFPAHASAARLGHSQRIASKHYSQVTDEYFEQALKGRAEAARQPHTSGCNDLCPVTADNKKTPVMQGLTSPCDSLLELPVGDTGFEPVTSAV
jgi:hypothetical protein